MTVMAYAAYLCVYEPVSAFREHAYVRRADGGTQAALRARDRWPAFAAFEQAN